MSATDYQATLLRKLRRGTSILTDQEVALITKKALEMLKDSFGDNPYFNTRSMEDIVRWSSLRSRCEKEREKRGLSLKDVSRRLKIPQYRLKAIECGELRALRPDAVREYFRFLGIDRWEARWRRSNRELAERAGLTRLTVEHQRRRKRLR
jgi:ribosome-binding protein aMBF1 (putative translation factor)